MPRIKGDGLNDKMKRFVAEYLIDQNALQATIRAGYSARSAYVHSNRLMQNPAVKAAIDAKLGKVLKKLDISVERIQMERARVAFLDPRKLVDIKGRPLGIHELDDDTAAAIAGFETELGRITKVKLADKNSSLTALEKMLGMYKDESGDKVPFNIHIHLE